VHLMLRLLILSLDEKMYVARVEDYVAVVIMSTEDGISLAVMSTRGSCFPSGRITCTG
jgi:hypothetical protein